MTDQQVKIVTTKQAEIYMNPLYESAFKRESLTMNTIYPEQSSSIGNAPTQMPQLLTIKVPNTGMLSTAQTVLQWKQKFVVPSVAALETVYQVNGAIYQSSAPTVKLIQLGMSALSFFDEVQVTKQNMKNDGLDFKQKKVYRSTIQYSTVDQEFANSFPDVLCGLNNTNRILYTNASTTTAETNKAIWVTFTCPLSLLCPLFAQYAWLPTGLLNSFLQLDITMNQNYTGAGTATWAAWGNFALKIAYYNNKQLLETLRQAGPIFGTFNDYNIQQIPATTRAADNVYKIDQEYTSLDLIQISAFASRASQTYLGGWNTIESDIATLPIEAIGRVQLAHNNLSMFTKQYDTIEDVFRSNGDYNNAATSFQEGLPDFAKPTNWMKNYQVFNLKLDDVSAADTFQAATYSGMHTTAGSNTIIEWGMQNYSGALQNSTASVASTAISFDLTFIFSNMFKLADGDWIVYGKSYEALGRAMEAK